MRRRSFVFGILGAGGVSSARGLELLSAKHVSYGAALRCALNIEAEAVHVVDGVLGLSDCDIAHLRQWCAPSLKRLMEVVGDQWHTAAHTIPSLVEEDWVAGRCRTLAGHEVTQTEIAVLLGEK